MKTLRGTGANSGRVTAKVNIVTEPGLLPRKIPGTILVVPYTTPLMTLALMSCVGIISEQGGITSHASIVAREFGIPCIVGVANVTKELKQGQTIIMDGEKGVISYEK
ncbi:MAG TPA: PEP-utilizing enzyme [Candidatus Nanoarchaeia archaeon]|nr:PEP-utilizing enzyme [Candidatus Nanoarchaeia archaeon]